MSELTPALASALAGRRVLMFGAVEIQLPSYDLCLLDGSGQVVIGSKTFVGRDPVYGVLDTIKGLTDMIGDKAPTVTLGLIPASDTALATLVSAAVQGSIVTIRIGAIDMATGLVVPDPYLVFTGELDVPTIKWAANDRRLEYRVTSVAERLFSIEEGRRLSSAFHKKVWPGELGLDFATDVETTVAWGQAVKNPGVQTRTNLPSMGGTTFSRTTGA